MFSTQNGLGQKSGGATEMVVLLLPSMAEELHLGHLSQWQVPVSQALLNV